METPLYLYRRTCAVLCSFALLSGDASGATLDFQLLTWNEAGATAELPSAVGLKPSAPMPSAGDWLIFTPDDASLPAGNNPAGALSHNLVDITGAGGPGFNLAPSLTGALTLELAPAEGSNWTVTLAALSYAGQANVVQAMNQFLVTPGSPATTNSAFKVDGVADAGVWIASGLQNWRIQFLQDFHLATNADGDPSPMDIDATFNNSPQTGFLIPVDQLTAEGLSGVALDDPLNFHTGDFEQFVLEQIKPRLPPEATYLLITQMGKAHPAYAEPGLPVTTASLLGNTTIAYSTQALGGVPRILSLRIRDGRAVIRFAGGPGQDFVPQRSSNLTDWETVADPVFSYPEAGVAEWVDPNPLSERQFYRLLATTP